MVRISRGTIAIMLAGLMLVILPGAALAQNGVQTWSEAYPVESYGPNRTVLEKYGDVMWWLTRRTGTRQIR